MSNSGFELVVLTYKYDLFKVKIFFFFFVFYPLSKFIVIFISAKENKDKKFLLHTIAQ